MNKRNCESGPRPRPLSLILAVAVAAGAAPAAFGQQQPQAQQPRQPPPATQPIPARRLDPTGQGIDAYVSSDALQAMYRREIDLEDMGPIDAGVGMLFSEARDLVGMADAFLDIGNPGAPNRRLDVRVGPRVYGAFLNVENEDVFAIALGGEARLWFDRRRASSVSVTLHYSPDILAFGAADEILDFAIRLETRLLERTDVYVGYRNLEFDVFGGDREVDDHLHVGFRRTF